MLNGGYEVAGRPASATLLLQMLAWIAAGPRSYEETMEAWRTSCPRLSVWEDAVGDGLVCLDTAGAAQQSMTRVKLTARGAAMIA